MLKYYLDKTGKVIKSILFPSSEFVDTEPREGSLNPVTSGGVAGSVSQQSSNIAPNYTKTTYPANSYVMQGGVLYTNPNAIGTAEDWNPAHWTEANVTSIISNVANNPVKNGGALTSAASIDVPNNAVSTLSTSEATLTLNVNVGATEVPNFAVEITAGAAITLTVTKTVGSTVTTLYASAAGGNTLESGKFYQLTCVGSCWTLAEFA